MKLCKRLSIIYAVFIFLNVCMLGILQPAAHEVQILQIRGSFFKHCFTELLCRGVCKQHTSQSDQ
jgi:hypothetical protein